MENLMNKNIPAKKKFSLWSDLLIEQQLIEDLSSNVSLGCSSTCIERDVESYNFRKKLKSSNTNSSIKANCKTRLKSKTRKKRLEIKHKIQKKKKKQANLIVSTSLSSSTKTKPLSSDQESIVKIISQQLNERKVNLIRNAVRVVGNEEIMKLFNETLDIENTGGIMINSGKRKRTPGGVFFTLLRNSKTITQLQKDKIFESEKRRSMKLGKHLKKTKHSKLKEKQIIQNEIINKLADVVALNSNEEEKCEDEMEDGEINE